MELWCSRRTTHKPLRYQLLGQSYQAISNDNEEDPVNYKETLEDVDAQEWLKAMDHEMESMYSNSVLCNDLYQIIQVYNAFDQV